MHRPTPSSTNDGRATGRDTRPTVVRLVPELDFGGVESRIVLQSELNPVDRVDLRVVAFHRAGRAAERIRASGTRVDVLDASPAVRNLSATWALARYLRRVRPDVVHASVGECMFHASVAGSVANVPAIVVEDVGVPSRGPTGQRVMRACYRLVDQVIGVSGATADALRAEGAGPRVLRVVYNCGKPEFFEDDVPKRGAVTAPFVFLTVGRLVPVKNQERLIRAFATCARGANAELWIAGDGELAPRLQEVVHEEGLPESVRFLGFRSDIKELYDRVDAFLLPSFSEGCSIAMIEAMARGLPCIGSRAGGIREVMGVLGDRWLVDAHDTEGWAQALLAMVDLRPSERRALSEVARHEAQTRFSPARYMETLVSTYETLGARRAPGIRRFLAAGVRA